MNRTDHPLGPPPGDDELETIAARIQIGIHERMGKARAPGRRRSRSSLGPATTTAPRNQTRHRRGRGYVAGGLVVVLLAGGGVAYARGDLPAFLQGAANDSALEAGSADTSPEVTNILDLTLPDGSRFGAWRWEVGDQGACMASADNWDGSSTGTGGVGCGPGKRDPNVSVQWAFGRDFMSDDVQPMYPVVYGYTTQNSITEVQLVGTVIDTGQPVDLIIPVDTATGGFGTVLPGTVDNKWDPQKIRRIGMGVTLTYLDAAGHAVGKSQELPNGR